MHTKNIIKNNSNSVNTYLDPEWINLNQAAQYYKISTSQWSKWWREAPDREKQQIGNQKHLRQKYACDLAQEHKAELLHRAALIPNNPPI